jgi:hypothetical protein
MNYNLTEFLITAAINTYNVSTRNVKLNPKDFSLTCVNPVSNSIFSFDVYSKSVEDQLRIRLHCTYSTSIVTGPVGNRIGTSLIKSTGGTEYQYSMDIGITELEFPIKELRKLCTNKTVENALIQEDGIFIILETGEYIVP